MTQLRKMPYLARATGRDNIPEPIAVPASRRTEPNNFFIPTPKNKAKTKMSANLAMENYSAEMSQHHGYN